MNRNMKLMIQELNKGKNLENNLESFAKAAIPVYYDNALISMALNYYTFYEMHLDDEAALSRIKEFTEKLNQIIADALKEETNIEHTEQKLNKITDLREEVTKRVEVLMSYADTLQNYEYIINRIELKYADSIPAVDEESSIQKITEYVFESKDQMIVNTRIKEVIGQLPVRMTKAKYFDLISDSLSIYKGSEKSAVDNYLYMLKSGAMLNKPEGMDIYFGELHSFVEQLGTTSFKELTKEEFEVLADKLDETAQFALTMSDVFMTLQQLINHLYIITAASPYITNSKAEDLGKDILRTVNECFMADSFETLSDKVEEQLAQTEGMQEGFYEKLSLFEGTIYEVTGRYGDLIEELKLDKLYDTISISQKLSSSSYFISLEEEPESQIADEEYISKVKVELLKEIEELFKQSNVFVRRAIIANTMDKFPIFFNNMDEVTEYIRSSLATCNDLAEKSASIELILQEANA